MATDAAFMQFPCLKTRRLRLRQIQPSDAAALFAIKSNPLVTQPYGRAPHGSLDDTRAWMQRIQASYDRHEVLVWCLTFQGKDEVIGTCLLWNFDPEYRCAEIGYELHPAYWRQGIMAEVVPVILDYGFTVLDLHRIEAVTLAANVSSQSLLGKFAFLHEGTLRQRLFVDGHYQDELYFGLLKDEWMRSTAVAAS